MPKKKNAAAAALGRLRATSLTPERRAEIARLGGMARQAKARYARVQGDALSRLADRLTAKTTEPGR